MGEGRAVRSRGDDKMSSCALEETVKRVGVDDWTCVSQRKSVVWSCVSSPFHPTESHGSTRDKFHLLTTSMTDPSDVFSPGVSV